MKLGIFGGTFDPVHWGHLLAARAALEELRLDRLLFVPAARSPFKSDSPAPAEFRLRLLRLALAGMPQFEIDSREITRQGPSYTIQTLREIARSHAGAELFFLIGSDHVGHLGQWHEAGELAGMATFVAIPRPGSPSPVFPHPFRGIGLKGWPLELSATGIRDRIRSGLPIDHLTPPAVAQAIMSSLPYPGSGTPTLQH